MLAHYVDSQEIVFVLPWLFVFNVGKADTNQQGEYAIKHMRTRIILSKLIKLQYNDRFLCPCFATKLLNLEKGIFSLQMLWISQCIAPNQNLVLVPQ